VQYPQVHSIIEDPVTEVAKVMAFPADVQFLKEPIQIPEWYCLITLRTAVNADRRESFLELLTEDDQGSNCVMTNLDPKTIETLPDQERRKAAFLAAGKNAYKKGATFL
jgi:hypothetical protein